MVQSLKEHLKQDMDAGNWPEIQEGIAGIALENRFKVFEDKAYEREEEKERKL